MEFAFLSILVIFGSWFDHVKGWLNAEEKERIIYVCYEEMIAVRLSSNP